jgi:transposase
MARKRYTKEFKQQAVQLVLNRSHTPTDAARELGIPQATMFAWLRRAGHIGVISNEPNFKTDDPAALKLQLRDLQKRLERAEMERDILKKATVFFASQQP